MSGSNDKTPQLAGRSQAAAGADLPPAAGGGWGDMSSVATSSSEDTGGVVVLPAEHWAEAPEDSSDGTNSAIDELIDSTVSLTASILQYKTIHGRTYHSDVGNAQYWGSNDEGHNKSLDIWHRMITLCLEERLYVSPIENPKRALDIGTGTGIWAIDFADMHPDCQVFGTDVSPIQPTWIPPNLVFEIEDCTQEWSFDDNEFDFVHIRALFGSISNWTALFREAYRCLEPGGWFESHELSVTVLAEDGPVPPNTAIGQWGPLFIEGGRRTGRSFTVLEDHLQEKAAVEAGFVDIRTEDIKAPTGSWPEDLRLREIGQLAQLSILQDIEGFILLLTEVLEWPRERVLVYIAHLRKELRAGKQRIYTMQRVLWARKPYE